METATPETRLPALDKVPPLQGAVLDLLRSLDDENINTTALAKKIGHDPVLSARVLKIVNSPFYGVAGQVSSLSEAVMVLGFSNVRSLAVAASLVGGFPLQGHGAADPRRLWRHSFCCALCAQALAPLVKVDADTAFTAGLLHDIGRIALLATMPAQFAGVLALRAQNGGDLEAAERAMLGCSHAQFGARLLARWRLPAPLVRAAECHHAPDTEPTSRLTDLVSVCDALSHAIEHGALADIVNTAEPNGAAIRLGVARAQYLDVLAGVPAQLEALAAVLN